MNVQQSYRRPGFTLVELLTVIAIIILLIGILIPALSAARTQAKQASTTGLLRSLDAGCEMFHGDFQHYPQSRGPNPFERNPAVLLMGAQWLALQLTGADGRGFVEPTVKNDADGDGQITNVDWLDWYALPGNQINPDRQYQRLGPYAEVDAKSLRCVVSYLEDYGDIQPPAPPNGLLEGSAEAGGSVWNNTRIPFFVDSFGDPVLYYRANSKVEAPFTTDTPTDSDFVVGRYDQADNAYFTGSAGDNGRWNTAFTEGWDLAGAGSTHGPPGDDNYAHAIGAFGYSASNPLDWPDPETFAAFVCDENIYESTQREDVGGRLWPYRPGSFLLISAGSDAVYGTGDDVTNFRAGG